MLNTLFTGFIMLGSMYTGVTLRTKIPALMDFIAGGDYWKKAQDRKTKYVRAAYNLLSLLHDASVVILTSSYLSQNFYKTRHERHYRDATGANPRSVYRALPDWV
jgi:hypothetical protein